MSDSSKEYTIDDVKREANNEIKKKEQSQRIQLIIFRMGSEEFGVSIEQIKEIVLTPNIAKMPQAPTYIKGVANIRGNIIAILNLEEKFGISESATIENKNSSYTMVLESETIKAGILVKDVPNTLTINVDDIDNASNFIQLSGVDENCIMGVVKSGERLIIMLDIMKLMETININTTVSKAIN